MSGQIDNLAINTANSGGKSHDQSVFGLKNEGNSRQAGYSPGVGGVCLEKLFSFIIKKRKKAQAWNRQN